MKVRYATPPIHHESFTTLQKSIAVVKPENTFLLTATILVTKLNCPSIHWLYRSRAPSGAHANDHRCDQPELGEFQCSLFRMLAEWNQTSWTGSDSNRRPASLASYIWTALLESCSGSCWLGNVAGRSCRLRPASGGTANGTNQQVTSAI